MAHAYMTRGQLSRALSALNMAVHLTPNEEHRIKVDLALAAAEIYLVQSRLSDAQQSIHYVQHRLQSVHYQGNSTTFLHLNTGMYALASGDLDRAEIQFNIV